MSATAATRTIQAGDKLPANITLLGQGNADKVDLAAHLASVKRAVVIGIPGAFTGTCMNSHVPQYITKSDELKAKGVDEVVCVTVNDAFVSQAFAEKVNAGDKVRVLADPRAEFVKALGLSFDATAVLGNVRSQRFALVVENGIVKQVFPEPDKTGLSVSSAESVLAKL